MKVDTRDQLKPPDWNNFVQQMLDRVVMNEIVSGPIDGTNLTFTLAHAVYGGKIALVYNGQFLTLGSSFDYELNGVTITMKKAPKRGKLVAHYIRT